MQEYLPFDWFDAADIAVVATVFWLIAIWLHNVRSRRAFVAVGVAGVVYLVAQVAGFALTAWLLQGFFAILALTLIIVFQEELRRLFDWIAVWGLGRKRDRPPTTVTDVLVRSVARLASTRTGALIVLPGSEPIDRHIEGGVRLDGRLSEPLLLSLFDSSTPGHDGAVLIRKDRVARFSVHLPLSKNQVDLGPGGTRHAAALGLAEQTDALCIVVSEERGTVSVARDARLEVLSQPQELLGMLHDFGIGRIATGDSARVQDSPLRTYWREGLLAVALASVLWVVRVPGATVGEVVRPATVVLEKLPADLIVESLDPATVSVRLSGLRRDLLIRSGKGLEVRVDALLAQLGRRTFQLEAADIRTPEGLEVISIEPSQIRLSLRAADGGAQNP
jgi:uncharacterized protein (TIGR00159 family)